MRRNYISPEYKYVKRAGTFNMIEQTSFFGSKMMDIQDKISITNENIIYYETSDGEQLNFLLEKNLQPKIYSSIKDKTENHTLVRDPAQGETQLNYNTRWIIDINLKSILRNYIFSTLKQWRTFEGVRNNMTIYNSANSSIVEYIDKNIISRFKYSSIDFYVQYKHFSQDGTLKYKNDFVEIVNSAEITNKTQTIISDDGSRIRIIFNQEKPSTEYNFNYYFNLYFDKL